MSLINDALRRADIEKRQRQSGGEPPNPPPLPPEETDAPAPRRRSPWTVLLGVALLVLVGVTVYGLWWGIGEIREQAGAAVQSASAAFDQAIARGTGSPARRNTAPASSAAQANPLRKQPAGDAAPGHPADTVARTYDPPDDEIEPVRLADAAAATSATAGDVPTPAEDAPASPATASGANAAVDVNLPDDWTTDLWLSRAASDSDSDGKSNADGVQVVGMFNRMLAALEAAAREAGTQQHGAGKAEASPTPTSPAKAQGATASAKPESSPPREAKATPAPPPPLPPVDTSNLKISSIMNGPNGGLAIINGRPVREGETVAGAKVVRISNRTVEVEIDGRRATVGM